LKFGRTIRAERRELPWAVEDGHSRVEQLQSFHHQINRDPPPRNLSQAPVTKPFGAFLLLLPFLS
jgi:hypothetical protein